ncbi:Armadillo-type fold [Amanita muscaria]
MDESLSKIRPHVSSSLLHQKRPATLLIALESTFKEQNTEPSPTAYFAALLTTLDGTIQRNDVNLAEGDILPAELYLLALILPFVPTPVIRTHLNTLLSLTSPLFPSLSGQAPPLRSQLSIYQTIFNTLDKSQLDSQGIRQSFTSILQLSIDPRPKVRKKAADVVRDVLAAPPPPLLCHPYAERVAEWVKAVLTGVNAGPLAKGKHSKPSEDFSPETAIHVISFLRPLLPVLPAAALPSLTTLLLSLPRLGNQYLSHSSYSALSDLFTLVAADTSSNIGNQIPEVLTVILASPPPKSDATLAPAWVQVLGDSMLAYARSNPESCANDIGKVWKAVWSYLDSNDPQTRRATVKSIDCLCRSLTHTVVLTAIADQQGKSMLRRAIIQVDKALGSLTYARAIPEVLAILSGMITNLSYKPGGRESPTAAESLLLPLIVKIGEMRTSKGFEHKEKADATLATAMKILGPEVLLTALPLNLEPADREAGREPRAFLLPLLSQPHPSPLSHFVSYFVPLSERMFALQQKAELEGRQSEAKVWSVLIAQIWAGLASYCAASPELQKTFPLAFSELLSQLLYTETELRPSVLKALKVVVESNVALASHDEGGTEPLSVTSDLSPEEASANIDFLRTQAESWLAVFFNLFTSINPDSRGMVGDVIKAWASITSQQDLNKTCQKLIKLFQTNLTTPRHVPANQGNIDGASVAATTQDILILLLPYLSSSEAKALFHLSLSEEVLSSKDNAIQKRGYKIFTKLIETEKVPVDDAPSILKRLDGLLEGVSQAAKKDRFNLIASVVPHIPPDSLHVMPSLIPEVVLGTKEPSEKARSAAFDLIVAMGKKMKEGGTVNRSLVDGMDEDGSVTASVEEFVTMIAGGLAGASPHMISATITALSRLVFEFKDSLSQTIHNELLSTMLVFLSSANREIVKSVLGFIKLVVHTLPMEFLRPHLKDLVPGLLNRSHDHKNHFKVRVRHIFERLMRRFRWEEIYEFAGDSEAAKVLVNIKKRKDRAKRKKALEREGGEEEVTPVKPVAGDAFEDVLYGSESEADDSDEDGSNVPATIPKKNNGVGSRIRLDDDEPMDLLSGAALRVTGKLSINLINEDASTARRRKPGQDAEYFKTDEETGKMVIDESEPEEENEEGEDVVGNAYRENLTSTDGFTRGRNGRVKFNKDTKKRRREEQEEDIEMDDGTMTKAKKSKAKAEAPKLGQAFKAKNAGGDVKKGGVDPYAYMSLADAAKRKGRGKIGIAGKR